MATFSSSVERRRLAGRAGDHEAVGAARQQRVGQTRRARRVDLKVDRERRHHGGQDGPEVLLSRVVDPLRDGVIGSGDEILQAYHRALQALHAANRQQHAGHERLARERVVADRQRLGDATEDDFLMSDERPAGAGCGSGRGRRRDRATAASRRRRRAASAPASVMSCAVRSEVPDGASSLPSSWISTISARERCRAASAAKRIMQHGAEREVGHDQQARAARRGGGAQMLESVVGETGGADERVDTRGEQARRVVATLVGVENSIATSARLRRQRAVDDA